MESQSLPPGVAKEVTKPTQEKPVKVRTGFKDSRLTALVQAHIAEFPEDSQEFVNEMLGRPSVDFVGNSKFDGILQSWWYKHFGFRFTEKIKRKEILANYVVPDEENSKANNINRVLNEEKSSAKISRKKEGIKKGILKDERFRKLIQDNLSEFPEDARDFVLNTLSSTTITIEQNAQFDALLSSWWKKRFKFRWEKSEKRNEMLEKVYKEEISEEDKRVLQNVRERVSKLARMGDGNQVKFIDKEKTDYSEPQIISNKEESVMAANEVYAGLLKTLDAIAGASLININKSQHSWKSAEILKGVEPLTAICRSLADNEIPLSVDQERINGRELVRDHIYAYVAKDVVIHGMDFSSIEVMIRPKKYQKPANIDLPVGAGVKLYEKADPRLSIYAFPKNMPQGFVHIRVDDNYYNEPKITYDVEIRPHKKNLIETANLREIEEVKTGQLEGHHFESEVRVEQFNVSYSDILEAFNEKIAKHVAGSRDEEKGTAAQSTIDQTRAELASLGTHPKLLLKREGR
jgi:hypothetical protein